MNALHWFLEWRDPWRWIGYLFPIVVSHRVLRRRDTRRRSPFALLMAIAHRIGEAGAAETMLVVVRLEAAARDTKNLQTIDARDREIVLLKRQLSTSASPSGSPSPSPTSDGQHMSA